MLVVVLFVVLWLLLVGGYFLFRDTLNRPQWIGRLYWLTRDNGVKGTPHVQRHAFMLGTAPPWKVSDSGILFRLGRHTFQIGLCHDAPLEDPTDEIAGLEYQLNYDPKQR